MNYTDGKPSIHGLRNSMSQGMFADLHAFALGLCKGDALEVERVALDAGGYAKGSGRYFDVQPGERIYRISHYRGALYLCCKATAPQIKRALGCTAPAI